MSGDVGPHPSGWTIAHEAVVYDSPWVRVGLADVTAPDGHRVPEHHTVRLPHQAAGTVVLVDGRVLLMWRHRFISRSTGWEIPAGRLDPGETPEQAAARECVEETGWRPGPLTPLLRWHPMAGVSDQTFHAFLATEAEHVGDPVDTHEAERLAWLSLPEVRRAVDDGEVVDGLAVPALLRLLLDRR